MLGTNSSVNVNPSLTSLSGVTSSAVNGLLDNVTGTSLEEHTDTSNVKDVTRNAGAISDGTTVMTSYFHEHVSVTNSDRTTDRIANNVTVFSYASVSASPLVLWIVIPVLILIVAVVIVLIWLYKRRRRRHVDIVKVYQVPGTHNIPKDKHKASWYEEEAGAEVNGGFNPDIELQPYNVTDSIICFGNDTGDELAPRNKEWSEKREADDSDSQSDSDISELVEDEAIREDVILRASVLKKSAQISEDSQKGQSSDDIYEFVSPVGDVETRSENNVNVADVSNDDDEDYIEMATDGSGQFQEVMLRHKGEDSGDTYANVEIRKVQSMRTAPYSNNKTGSHLPKRGASESNMHSYRPPKAQPRDSTKKRLDRNDTIPEIPKRIPINDIPEHSKAVTTDNNAQHGEQSTDDESLPDTLKSAETNNKDSTGHHYSDTDSCEEDNIYDYPRNNSQVVYGEDLEEESIYKIPPSVNT